jgi:phosphoserine phosphatase RsbU/P
LVDQLASEYAETIVSEMAAASREHGVETVCLAGGKLFPADLTASRHVVFDLATRASVDALVLVPLGGHIATSELVAFCRRYEPLPICGIAISWAEHPSVLVDNETGFREGIRHLIDVHGLRRLAFVRGPELNSDAQLRYQVYEDVLSERGIALDPALVAPGTLEYDGGVHAVRLLLDSRKVAFDAVVCANDAMAFGAIDELKRRGVIPPGQVAVIGFDDLRVSRYIDPALTTVRQPLRAQVRRAFGVVFAALRGGAEPQQTVLTTSLVVRESCGCQAYVHPSVYGWDARPDAEDDAESMRRFASIVVDAVREGDIFSAHDTSGLELLCTEFVAELAGDGRAFLSELTRVLAAAARDEADVGEFHRLINVLVDLSQRHLGDEALRWADALLHAARVKVNGVAGRIPMRRLFHVEDATGTLLSASRDLAAVTDLASLRERLVARLVGSSIGAFYICRYEAERGASGWSRLIVGHDRAAEGALPVPAQGVRFPSDELLPDGPWWSDRFTTRVVCPLDCGEGASGYVVFEGWTGHGLLYEALAGPVGSALGRIALLDRLVADTRAREIAEANRLGAEMRIASEVQAAIVPQDVRVGGLEIAAAMRPATEVAGDYYDVIPTERGCWIGIGDVSGHGLIAGLATLIMHSVVSGVSRRHPDAAPGDLFALVNFVFYESVRNRMGQEQHSTLTLLRYEQSGRVVCAGAHEVILVCRSEDGRICLIDPPGTWLGLVPDVRHLTADTDFELHVGDLMVLFTDGVTEATSPSGEMFGIDRLIAEVSRLRREPVPDIRDALLATVGQWAPFQRDDLSLVVARHHGASPAQGTTLPPAGVGGPPQR